MEPLKEIEENNSNKKSRKHRFLLWYIPDFLWNFLKYGIFILVAFLMGIYFLVQLPSFQNYAIQKVTKFLSEELKTEVKVGRIRLTFFQSLVLEDFLVKDRSKDTLLNAGYLKVGLKGGLLGLIDGKVTVDDVYLKNVYVNLFQNGPKFDNNYQFILNFIENGHPDSLFSKPSNNPGNLKFSLNTIVLSNIQCNFRNIGDGQYFDIFLEDSKFDFKTFDLEKNLFELDNIELIGPKVSIRKDSPKKYSENTIKNPYQYLYDRRIRPPKPALQIIAKAFSIEEGELGFHNNRSGVNQTRKQNHINFNHLDLSEINIALNDVTYSGENEIETIINQLSFKTPTTFDVSNLTARSAKFDNNKLQLSDFSLVTNYSDLGGNLQFDYSSLKAFQDFENEVNLSGNIANGRFAFKDVEVFAAEIEKVDIIQKNKNKTINIAGHFDGKINDFKVHDLTLKVENEATFIGDFNATNITDAKTAVIDVAINELVTDVNGIQGILPEFKVTPEMRKLGKVRFTGRHSGNFLNFNTEGDFSTQLGKGKITLEMNLLNGVSKARYSGILSLQNFKLDVLTGNPDLGNFTGDLIIQDGYGFDFEQMSTKLVTKVKNLTFKGYQYKNIDLAGVLNAKKFIGDIMVNDPNLDLDLKGKIDFSEKQKILEFVGDIRNFDPNKTNLFESPFSFSGLINSNIRFSNLDDIDGKFYGNNIKLVNKNGEQLLINFLNFNANNEKDGSKDYVFKSDLIDFSINGKYRLQSLTNDFKHIIHFNHLDFANQLNIHGNNNTISDNDFKFNFNLKNSKNFLKMLDIPIDSLVNVSLTGKFKNVDSTAYELLINGGVPELKMANFNLKHVYLEGFGNQTSSEYFIFATGGKLNQINLSQMDLSATLQRNKINFNAKTPRLENIAENLNLDLDYTIENGYNTLRFNSSKFDFFNDGWQVSDHNSVMFKPGELIVNNINFTNGEQNIVINSFGQQGLNLDVDNFHAELINTFTKKYNFEFNGKGDLKVKIDSIFSLKNISLIGDFEDLKVNSISLGKMDIESELASLNDKLLLNLNFKDSLGAFNAKGFYVLPDYKGKDYPENYVDLSLTAKDYSLSVLDVFLNSVISNTTGNFDAQVNVKGPANRLSTQGKFDLSNLATTINYLGTRYYLTKHSISLNNNRLDFGDAILLDELGNTAHLTGGIVHDRFKNLGADFEVRSDNFMILKTDKKINPIYYGTATGKLFCSMTGPFNQLDIFVDATSGPNTNITMPINQETDIQEVSFIEFKDRLDTTIQKKLNEAQLTSGLQLKMNLEINENAQINILFDEKTNNLLRGKGNGVIEIEIPRNGTLSMYGNFEVENGSYLFSTATLYNFSFLKFPFALSKGGTISWSGDPFGAQVNIDAEYLGINTAPYNLIAEYLPENNNLSVEASKPTPVKLSLNLSGKLFNPDINFDIQLPNVGSELKTYVDNKLNYLKQNSNEMTSQVAYLLVLKSFLPASNSISDYGRTALTSTVNSISNIISDQITNLLSPMLNKAIAGNSVISGIGLNFKYSFYDANLNSGVGTSAVQQSFGSELVIGPSFRLFGDRLILTTNAKSNSGSATAEDYITGDLELQYAITPNRRYLLRLYSRGDAVLEGRRTKSGIGFSYQRTVDSIKELFTKEDRKR